MKDQQEAERKKMASQEIQQALEAQTMVIAEKQESVRNDLAKVEPAVLEAQQGRKVSIAVMSCADLYCAASEVLRRADSRK